MNRFDAMAGVRYLVDRCREKPSSLESGSAACRQTSPMGKWRQKCQLLFPEISKSHALAEFNTEPRAEELQMTLDSNHLPTGWPDDCRRKTAELVNKEIERIVVAVEDHAVKMSQAGVPMPSALLGETVLVTILNELRKQVRGVVIDMPQPPSPSSG
jgi:hypothetical protein